MRKSSPSIARRIAACDPQNIPFELEFAATSASNEDSRAAGASTDALTALIAGQQKRMSTNR
jgi:hypothetical protein